MHYFCAIEMNQQVQFSNNEFINVLWKGGGGGYASPGLTVSLRTSQVAHPTGVYSSFFSMKQLGDSGHSTPS